MAQIAAIALRISAAVLKMSLMSYNKPCINSCKNNEHHNRLQPCFNMSSQYQSIMEQFCFMLVVDRQQNPLSGVSQCECLAGFPTPLCGLTAPGALAVFASQHLASAATAHANAVASSLLLDVWT